MWRRGLGAAFLLAALAMLIAGETVLRERLRGVGFVIFWLACLLFTFTAIVIAFLDVSAIRRRTSEEQRALFQSTLHQIAREKQQNDRERSDGEGRCD